MGSLCDGIHRRRSLAGRGLGAEGAAERAGALSRSGEPETGAEHAFVIAAAVVGSARNDEG